MPLQRNLILYLMNQFLFKAEINPVLIVQITRMFANDDKETDPRKKKAKMKHYFAVSLLPDLERLQHNILQFQQFVDKSSRRVIVLPEEVMVSSVTQKQFNLNAAALSSNNNNNSILKSSNILG